MRLVAQSAFIHSLPVSITIFAAVLDEMVVAAAAISTPVVFLRNLLMLLEAWAVPENVVLAPTEAALVWRPHNSIAMVHIDDHLWLINPSVVRIFQPRWYVDPKR